jgi:hypothetical protein
VAGVIKQPDIGTLQQRAELLDPGVEAGFVEIRLRYSADQRESQPSQGLGHQPGIVRGVRQRRNIDVGGVADHERDSPFRRSRRYELAMTPSATAATHRPVQPICPAPKRAKA